MNGLVICFDRLVKRQFELIPNLLASTVFQDIQPVFNIPGIVDDYCFKYPIPDREYVTVIGVRPGPFIVMMKLMHIWSNEYPPNCFVNPDWKIDIGVCHIGE